MSQDRKVFVGGVPQDLTQDDLYAIFCEYAGVKKAWLQKCRPVDHGGSNAVTSPPQNHRGFGFVIFHDARAIDEILGNGSSRFILLRNGAKLEVKRALSSNKMGTPQTESVTVPPLQGSYPPHPSNQQPCGAPGEPHHDRRGQISLMPLASTAIAGYPVNTQTARRGDWQQQHWSLATAAAPGLRSTGQQSNGNRVIGIGDPAENGPSKRLEPVPPRTLTGGPPASHAPLRKALVHFYNANRPEKLTERDFIDFICSVYEGREAELDAALRQKYGQGLQLPKGSQDTALAQTNGDGGLAPSSGVPAYVNPSKAWSALVTQQSSAARKIPAAPLSVGPWTVGAGSLQIGSPGKTAFEHQDGPDLSWIDQMVGDDWRDNSEELRVELEMPCG